jgi:hypothetical protein
MLCVALLLGCNLGRSVRTTRVGAQDMQNDSAPLRLYFAEILTQPRIRRPPRTLAPTTNGKQTSTCVFCRGDLLLCAACVLANTHVLCLGLTSPTQSPISNMLHPHCLLFPLSLCRYASVQEGGRQQQQRPAQHNLLGESECTGTNTSSAAAVHRSAATSTAVAACCVFELQRPVHALVCASSTCAPSVGRRRPCCESCCLHIARIS